jgi:hypothetical protein
VDRLGEALPLCVATDMLDQRVGEDEVETLAAKGCRQEASAWTRI